MEIEIKTALAGKIFPARFHDASFVTEYGKIESLRAVRYGTRFSIVLMEIEGIDAVDDGEVPEPMRKIATAVVDSVRNCDIAGLTDERQVCIILPETDYFGSLAAIRKVYKSVTSAIGKNYTGVSLSLSQATFPRDGKGFGELLTTAIKRAAEKRESLWEKNGFRDKLFWEILGEISGKTYRGNESSSFDAGGGQGLSDTFIDHVNELIISEVTRGPHKKGVLIFAAKKITTGMPVISELVSAGTISTKVFLIGEGEDKLWDLKFATPISLDDPRLRETFFTFFLSEETAYALICKENWGATYTCFHTSDPNLVEGLITKFQGEYSLQEQIG